MALFFQFPTGGRAKPVCLAWCNTDSILAVGTAKNTVDFYLEEGDPLSECSIKQVSRPEILAWHPHKPVLAVGYARGKVLVWDHNSRTLGDSRKQPHLQSHASVTFLRWSPDGSRVVSGDSGGNVCVWSYRGRGMTTLLAKYRSSAAVYHAVFCAAPPSEAAAAARAAAEAAAAARGGSKLGGKGMGVLAKKGRMAECPPFFFGGDSGEIIYADDMGNKATVQDMQSAIHSMLYHHTQQRLVVITQKLMLAQLRVTPDGSVSPLMKVKLSMASEGGISASCWAGDGLLATCAGEPNVRLWDLTHNSNYLLGLSAHNKQQATGTRKIAKTDRIVTMDYNPRKRVLAAGTRDGNVVMWKNLAAASAPAAPPGSALPGAGVALSSGAARDVVTGAAARAAAAAAAAATARAPSTAESWKCLPVVGLNGRIQGLHWGAGEQLVAARTAEGATILSETVLHRKMFGPLAAIQVSADRISLQSAGSSGAEPFVLRTGIRIKGMDLHGTSLIVWNGRKCEVYSIPASSANGGSIEATLSGSFPTKSRACAVHNDNIFCAVGSRVEVCNHQGTVKSALSFTEAEGQPEHIDSNDKFLAVVTTTGVLKMFDVSRREPRQLGSAGKFVDPDTGESIGVVRSVRCNADGTCMSLLADRKAGAYLRAPDERLHVYNLDLAAISSYDFGPAARYPVAHAWDPEEARLMVCETYKLLTPSKRKARPRSAARKTGEGEKSDAGDPGGDGAKAHSGNEEERIRAIQRQKSQTLDVEQQAEVEVTTLFATVEHGVLKQDSRPLEAGLNSLLGLHVPNLYFVSNPQKGDDSDRVVAPRLVRRALRDFAGLDRVDDEIKRALMDFSFYLTIGDMDLAYKVRKCVARSCSNAPITHIAHRSITHPLTPTNHTHTHTHTQNTGGPPDRRIAGVGEHGADVRQDQAPRRCRGVLGHDGPRAGRSRRPGGGGGARAGCPDRHGGSPAGPVGGCGAAVLGVRAVGPAQQALPELGPVGQGHPGSAGARPGAHAHHALQVRTVPRDRRRRPQRDPPLRAVGHSPPRGAPDVVRGRPDREPGPVRAQAGRPEAVQVVGPVLRVPGRARHGTAVLHARQGLPGAGAGALPRPGL